MKKVIFLLVSILCVFTLNAQWAQDAAQPNLIADGVGDQSLPKVAISNNGNTFIGYFDNSSGAYQNRLKLYAHTGDEIWAEAMVLAGTAHDSWLTDWDMTVDNDGNALMCFQDVRSGINRVYIYKISPNGAQLWGETGICLSNDPANDDPDYSPVLLCNSDNSVYVAWHREGTYQSVFIQKLNPDGSFAWAQPALIAFYGASANWPQLLETVDNGILVKYYEDSGVPWAPQRELHVASFSAAGELIWTEAVSTAGGISAWTQRIAFIGDGSGGAFLAWHDDRDMDMIAQGYFAHVSADGDCLTPQNGAYACSNMQLQQFYPRLALDLAQEKVYCIMRITDTDQNNAGMLMQIFDFEGQRLLGVSGQYLQGIGQTNYDAHFAWFFDGRIYNFYESSVQTIQQSLYCGFNETAGAFDDWLQIPFASTTTAKMHYDFATHPNGWVICTWEDGSSAYDIYAMKIWHNGQIGKYRGRPEAFVAEYVEPKGIRLSWQAPLHTLPDAYLVEIADFSDTLLADAFEYFVQDLSPGTYQCQVSAIYGDESYATEPQTVEIPVLSNADLVASLPRLQCYPNPFRQESKIYLDLAEAGDYRLEIYNLRGQKVRSLHQGTLAKKEYEFSWDAKDELGNSCAAGVYLYRFTGKAGSQIVKALYVK